MGIFSSLKSLVGSSESYYESAKHYLSESGKEANKAASEAGEVVTNVLSPKTMYGIIPAFLGYEHIAGRIISANTATHLANIFTGGEFTLLETVTKAAATALVADPVSCMGALMLSSALLTNHEGIFNAVSGTFKSACNTVAAAGKFLYAGANAGAGLIADALDVADQVETKVADFLEPNYTLKNDLISFENPLFKVTGDVLSSLTDALL